MNAQVDGKLWQAVERVVYFVCPPGDTATPGTSPRGLLATVAVCPSAKSLAP